jgi:hypothetical protein
MPYLNCGTKSVTPNFGVENKKWEDFFNPPKLLSSFTTNILWDQSLKL